METFTVYEAKRTGNEIRNSSEANGGYRIVAGKHVPHTGIENYTTRVYQGSTVQDAARAAYAAETHAVIRAQIARFFDVENITRESAQARELARIIAPTVHEFASSKTAFDLACRFINISFGDILVIPSEKVAGIACGQPFAVTAVAGDLDQLTGSIMHALDGRGITSPYLRAAANEAARRGYALANWAYSLRGE